MSYIFTTFTSSENSQQTQLITSATKLPTVPQNLLAVSIKHEPSGLRKDVVEEWCRLRANYQIGKVGTAPSAVDNSRLTLTS